MTLKQLQVKLNSLIDDVVNKDTMGKIGKEAASLVKTRTRKGFSVSENGASPTKLKGISESYKKQRKRLASSGKLSSNTQANKSNLTNTGQMIDNVTHKASNNEATVFIKGNKNNEKAFHGQTERPFMNLSKGEETKISKIIEEEIRKDITKKGL